MLDAKGHVAFLSDPLGESGAMYTVHFMILGSLESL